MSKKLHTLMPLIEEKTGREFTFAVDDENGLYLNGEQVAYRQEVTLSRWVNVAIVSGGLATVVMALPTVGEILCAAWCLIK